MLFYSCLYHSFASPRLLARKAETFEDEDHQQHVAAFDRYGVVPFWDTGRNQIVLLTLLEPEGEAQHLLRSELDIAQENGYMPPPSMETTPSSCISATGSAD